MVIDRQSKYPGFKSTEWLEDQLNLSSFQGRSGESQEVLGTYW